MAANPFATPTLDGNNDSSSSSTTTTTTETSPYAQFKGNNYEELEQFIRGQMESIKPETKEEREKREKREKRVGFLARLAEGLGTFHTAYSHARGVKAMEMPKMSARAQELFDKAKAQRDKENDRLVNYAIILGNIRDKDREFNLRVAQAEQQQSNWQQQFDTDNEHWQKGFDENQRQFDVTSKEHERHNRASEGLQSAGIAETIRHNKASEDGKYTEFYSGNGMVRIPNTRLNQHNLSYIYQQIKVAKTDKGKPTGEYTTLPLTTTDINGKVTPVSAEQMMQAIGAHIDDPNVQSALRAIGGEQVSKKKPLPGSETNGKKPLP